MAKFDLYIETLLLHEGGWANHPDDPGKATNMGITLATFLDYKIDMNGDGKYDVADLKKLTKYRASLIYKRGYWDAILLDQVKNQSVAQIIFDFGVNSGVGRAVRMVKYILNKYFGQNWRLSSTISADLIKALNAVDAQTFFNRTVEFRYAYYQYRATRLHPQHELIPYLRLSLKEGGMGLAPSASALSFIAGWLKRLYSFKYKA